jgi:hypothetical protein
MEYKVIKKTGNEAIGPGEPKKISSKAMKE